MGGDLGDTRSARSNKGLVRPGDVAGGGPAYAGPAVRKMAREFGVDLAQVDGSGEAGRVLVEDLHRHVRQALARATVSHGALFSEADATELEALRQTFNADGARITMVSFVIKAMVATLRRFPHFNAALDGDARALVGHFHIGFAVEAPGGVMMPVVRDVDRKGLREISAEVAGLALQAREGRIRQADREGGCISISSLDEIGGLGFTPMIHGRDVAALGVAPAAVKPVWDGQGFAPRLMLPLALSWDHRVADGAEAARFLGCLTGVLGDVRQILL